MKAGISDRTTIELHQSNDPKGYYVAHVSVDDEFIVAIWCNSISVYATKPPIYCLKIGEVSVAGIGAKLIKIHPELRGVIPDDTLKALGKYAEITQ